MWSGIKKAYKSRKADKSSIYYTYKVSIIAKTGKDERLAGSMRALFFILFG